MTSKQDTDPLKLAVKQHFAFLADDFGFEKHATPKNKNPFSVWYVNGTSRIVVESINYGMNARVALGRSGPIDTFENYDLLDCVDVCSPNAAMDPPGSWTPRGQWTPRNGPPGVMDPPGSGHEKYLIFPWKLLNFPLKIGLY